MLMSLFFLFIIQQSYVGQVTCCFVRMSSGCNYDVLWYRCYGACMVVSKLVQLYKN